MTCSRKFRPLRNAQSGQGMVELALCLPVFVLVILASAEIANIAWASIQLNNAAHAGAQFGSQSRANASDPVDPTTGIGVIELATRNEAPKLTITFPTAPAQACSCIDPSTGATGAGSTGCQTLVECPAPYVIFDNITVNTQAVVTTLIHYPGLPRSYTLNATATMGVIK
jgi:Flp pilus assembly protein TadG